MIHYEQSGSLIYTGNSIVIITSGEGEFIVDKDLMKTTKINLLL